MAPDTCRAAQRLGHASWRALGTSVVLRLTAPEALATARASVQRELHAIDRSCSRFRADSELSAVNASAGHPTRISGLLLEALELSLRAAELTGGDVDPTIGKALELAGYDRDWELLPPPREAHRSSGAPRTRASRPRPTVTARTLAGWRAIALDRDTATVRLPRGIHLDLGATAKAWAADRAAAAAAESARCGVLVSIGGDIAVSGPPPPAGWHVHVSDDHRDDPSAAGQTISLRCGGLATSSTTTRRWRHAGRDMHHIIDPRTRAPARAQWRTVSVAAASCAEANIAATAAIVRGTAAVRWLGDSGLPARLVDQDGGVLEIAGWPRERP